MKNFSKSSLLKMVMFSLAILMGLYGTSKAQEDKVLRDPSTITVVPMSQEGGRAVGDDCTNPIIVSIPSASPYYNANSTCGRLNDYSLPSSGCMYYYTSGEDIIYRLDATANTTVTLTMNPGATTYGGIGIFLGCPNTGTCLGADYGYAASPKVIPNVSLTAGNQYYVMIDTWASPSCIPDFSLNIVATITPIQIPCPDGSIFGIPPVSSNNAYNSTLGSGDHVYQSFSGVTGAIGTITFWGIFSWAPPPSPVFKIDLCQPGATPGPLWNTITTPITAVNTGQMLLSYPIYVFTVGIPATFLGAGWVGIEQQTPSPYFYWLNTMAGAGFPAYEWPNQLPDRVALCLGGASQDCCPDFVLKDAVEICPPEISCFSSFSAPAFMAACKNSLHTYTVYPNDPGFTYTWTVTGGTSAGITGNPMDIMWGNVSTGYIKVVINSITPGLNCNDSIMMEICLIDGPEADFMISPNPACEGTLIHFTNSSNSGSVYHWDFGDGTDTTVMNANPVDHPYASDGTYTVTLTATDMGQGLYINDSLTVPCGCSDIATHTVVIQPGVGPTIETDCCYGTVCPGETSSFCTPMLCTSPYDWSVTGGDIISGDGTSCILVKWYNTFIFPTTVTLQNCASSTCPGSTTLYVPVLYPNLPIDGPNTLCVGASGSYSLPTLPGTFYTWTVTGGNYGGNYAFNLKDRNVPTVNITFIYPGIYFVTCDYDNPLAGCHGISTFQVDVLPKFSITGNEKVCEDDPASFSTDGVFINGPLANWIISPSGPAISGNGSQAVTISNWLPGNYVLTAIALPPYDVFCNLTATKNIEVVAKPILGSIEGADSVCTGENYTFSITSNTSGSPFIWPEVPGVLDVISQMGDDNDSVVIQFSGLGPWTIEVYQEIEIIPGNLPCQSQHVTRVVQPFLAPDIVGFSTVCVDDILPYTANGSIPPGGFQWSISPVNQGTIVGGQGTKTADIRWHGPAGTATITVTTCAGSDNYTVMINNMPNAVATPNQTPFFCLGEVNTLSISTPYNVNYQYQWYENNMSMGPSQTSSTLNINVATYYTGPGTCSYFVVVKENCCSDTSNMVDVIISTCIGGGGGCPAVAYFSVYVWCDQITLFNHSYFVPPATGMTYLWSITPGAGTTISNASAFEPIITVQASGAYTITLTVTSSTGCTSTWSQDINVLIPVADFTFPPEVCENTAATFNAIPYNLNYNYFWTFGDGSTSYDAITQHSYASAALSPYTVTLVITDDVGCIAAISYDITVNPTPVCNITSPDTYICPGSFVVITACSGMDTYQWYRNGNPVTGSTSDTIHANKYGEYWVEVTNSYPCSNISNKIYIYMYQLPRAKITGDGYICAVPGGTAVFELSSIYDNNYSYNWSSIPPGATFTQGYYTTVTLYPVPAVLPAYYQIIVNVTDINTLCVNSDTMCVTIYETPPLSIVSVPPLDCEGTSYTLTPTPNNTTLYNYQWNNGATTPVITVSTAGFYSLTITDKATGCDSTKYAGSINPKPDLSLFPIGCAKLCEPDTLHLYIPLPLNALHPYNSYADAYPFIGWYDNGIFAAADSLFNFPAGTLGYHEFSVIVQNSFGCLDTAGKFCLTDACCFAETDPLYTKIQSNITYSTDVVWDGKYYIDDNIIVTVSSGAILDITDVDVVFGRCAGIVFSNGASLRANNSVFRPCEIDSTWKGLKFVGTGNFDNIINESTFKNAEVALLFEGTADGVISNNLFSNCNYGVRVEGNNSFNHPISGNRFVTEQFYPKYDDLCKYSFVNISSAYGIYSTSSRFKEQVSHNEFINTLGTADPKTHGIYQVNGGGVFSNNTFTDLSYSIFLSAALYSTIMENNEIEINEAVNSFLAAIYISSSNTPVIEINNNEISDNYNQYNCVSAIYTTNSSKVSIVNNKIAGFQYGIHADNGKYFQISNNEITDADHAGIYIRCRGNYKNFITCNNVKMRNFTNTKGLYAQDLNVLSQISSNCFNNCSASLDIQTSTTSGAVLPKIRNNFLYNYTVAGINVVGYSGTSNIGTLSPPDPGLNTLWSNYNLATDINSSNNIKVADNFGMFNISPTVQILSNRPYHSTASCAKQIFNMPSQGNLNVNYTCDNYKDLYGLLTGSGGQYSLSNDYKEQLKSSENQFDDADLILASIEPADPDFLNEIIGLTNLTENEKSILKYNFYYRNSDFVNARLNINQFTPADNDEADYKTLCLYDLDIIDHGWDALSETDFNNLSLIKDKRSYNSNFAITLMNNSSTYRDHIFDVIELPEVTSNSDVIHIDDNSNFLMIRPNPATDKVYIDLVHNSEAEGKIQMFDVSGKLVTNFTISFVTGTIELDIRNLSEGFYFVSLTDAKSGIVKTGKLIKFKQTRQ